MVAPTISGLQILGPCLKAESRHSGLAARRTVLRSFHILLRSEQFDQF